MFLLHIPIVVTRAWAGFTVYDQHVPVGEGRFMWGSENLLGPGLVIIFAYILLPVSNTFHWVLTSRDPLLIVIHQVL